MRALSKRESRLVAVMILIIALVLADLIVVQPLISGFTERAQARRDLAMRYAANQRLIAAIPRLVREAARHDAALGRFVLAAPDAGAAADVLHQRVQSAVNAVGGSFRGSEDLPPTPGAVATRASLRLTTAQLARAIALLENGSPLITVTAIATGADDALVTGTATDLDVQLDLTLAFRPAPAR